MVIIAVSMILGLALSGATLTASKQFHKTDDRNKVTDVAEMGIAYYQTLVNQLVVKAEDAATKKTAIDVKTQIDQEMLQHKSRLITDAQIVLTYNRNFCEKFKQLQQESLAANTNFKKINDLTYESDFFTVEGENKYKVKANIVSTCTDAESFPVTFESTGKTANENITLSGNFVVAKSNTLNRVGEQGPNLSAFSLINQLDLQLTGNDVLSTNIIALLNGTLLGNTFLSITNEAYIKILNLSGNAGLLVQGDTIFDSLSMGGNGTLIVFGDVFLRTGIDTLDGNAFDVCIIGNTYLVDSNNKLQPLPNYSNLRNVCGKGSWGIDPENGINVTY
ncbi:hypothetical protein [Neobacillus sp. SAB-20_R2A]|uniref:hypothetical protein n=1 Tax=Neobacillus sp. SAB-20_R2A TaxID=3120519 RepID=UPI003C6E83C2